MGKDSAIAWTDHTWNPWWGCSKLPDRRECDHCYAEGFAKRVGAHVWGPSAQRRIASTKVWADPYVWDRQAAAAGKRAVVFCMSMGDLFELRPELDEPRKRAFQVMRETPHLTWLLLTKRVEALELLPHDLGEQRNRILVGATVGTHRAAHSPFIVDFISAEPLLEAVDLRSWISWGAKTVIVGAESAGQRPGRECRIEWVRDIRDQCAEAGVLLFVKQLHIDGKLSHDPAEWPDDLRVRELAWRLP